MSLASIAPLPALVVGGDLGSGTLPEAREYEITFPEIANGNFPDDKRMNENRAHIQ